jgi:nicotinamidase-related amidase
MRTNANPYSLLDSDDSILIVVDVQDAFLDKLSRPDSERLLNNVCWLVRLAQWLHMPLVVTAEELGRQPLARQLAETLPASIPVFDKMIFDLAGQPDILAAVERTGRKTAVLVGLETDVCVLHSAVGLLGRGYRVAVVSDATGSPIPGSELGLQRMRSAGATIINMKGLFYEWLRTVEAVERFHRELPDMRGLAGTVL